MKRLLASLALLSVAGSVPAFAADLPAKAVPVKAAVAVAPSPFYVFVHGGAGFTDVQNDIALPGVSTGTPKLWPAGFMVGGGLGYLSTIGPLSVGLEAEANYDFTRASVGCSPVTAMVGADCLGSAKNSWFFAEKALVGITLSQIAGYIPGSAQPANWPVPITVPASFNQNMMLLGVIGAAQRNVDFCAMDVGTGSSLCGSQWKNGLLTGAQARFAVSPNVSVRVEYDYILFNQTFTPTQSIPFFANTVAAKNEQRLMAGFNINLPTTW
jgi:opacity protein-like surface antigen